MNDLYQTAEKKVKGVSWVIANEHITATTKIAQDMVREGADVNVPQWIGIGDTNRIHLSFFIHHKRNV